MMAKLQKCKECFRIKRLENIYVKEKLKTANGNSIYFNGDKDELIDDLITAFNKAIDDADHVNENEMRNTAFNMFPGMGG